MKTHHEFLRELRADPIGLKELTDELKTLGFAGVTAVVDRGYSSNEILKEALEALETVDFPDTASHKLQELFRIVQAELRMRARLTDLDLWRNVFRLAGIAEPTAVEEITDPGRCNYLYRLSTGTGRYVARYHDPTGRVFMQRHEPIKAAAIYATATRLFQGCLRDSQSAAVVPILYPSPDAGLGPIAAEDGDEFAAVVLNRIVIQPDQVPECELLSSGRFTPGEIADAIAGSLADVHVASMGLADRPVEGRADSILTGAHHSSRSLLRFANPDEYLSWLVKGNWIWRRLRVLKDDERFGVFRLLLNVLGVTPKELRQIYKALADQSARAMDNYGTLVHLDHAPHNCFIRKTAQQHTIRLFDFDYVAIADPAYDLGIALNSLIQCVARQVNATFDELMDVVARALRRYGSAIGDEHSQEICQRACAFAAFAMALRIERHRAMPTQFNTPIEVVEKVCIRLAGSLLPLPTTHTPFVDMDEIYGGKFLAASAARINRDIWNSLLTPKGEMLGAGPDEYLPVWRQLVNEVMDDYRTQRDTIESQLEIPDYRPRTWYGVLPGGEQQPPEFETSGYHGRKITWKDVRRVGPRVCVLVAIENGYRRTYQALAGLAFDVDELMSANQKYSIEFHVCVNFSDDNTAYEVTRFAKTIAAVRDMSLFFYEIDDPRHLGGVGRRNRWLKTLVLNVMLEEINHGERDDHEVYLHFADDDVRLDSGRAVVANNIDYLNAHQEVLIVSGAYSCDDDYGFKALASAWKRRRHFAGESGRILNLYGGCMTTTLDRLERVLDTAGKVQLPRHENEETDFGEDSYLTVRSNLACLRQGGPPIAFARCELPVYHPEADSVVSYVRRYARDLLWGHASVSFVDQTLGDSYTTQRQASFDFIHTRLAESPVRDRLAAHWISAVRQDVKELMRGQGTMPPSLSRLRTMDWATQKTQHQVCKELVNDAALFQAVVRTAKGGGLGFSIVQRLEDGASDPARQFPVLSRQLALCRHDIVEILRRNRYLYRWYSIAEESLAVLKKLLELDPARADRVAKRLILSTERNRELEIAYHFNLKEVIVRVLGMDSQALTFHDTEEWNSRVGAYRDNRPRSRRRSYTLFLDTSTERLFLRYFPTVGRGSFLDDSPRRIVYLHLLGEQVMREVQRSPEVIDALSTDPSAIPICIPRTRYPDLKHALVNYAGPEQRTAEARFAQAFYVQERVPDTAHRLWKSKLGESHYKRLTGSLAAFAGCLHGLTFGMRAILDQDYLQTDRPRSEHQMYAWPLFSNLVENLNQIGLFSPSVYLKWISSGGRRGLDVTNMLDQAQHSGSGIAAEVEGIIRQEGLSVKDIWRLTCDESTGCHKRFGSVGHLGITARNISVSMAEGAGWTSSQWGGQHIYLAGPDARLTDIYLPVHLGVSMIDPAVEAGFVLDELISARISSAVIARSVEEPGDLEIDDESLTKIWKSFVTGYGKVFGALLGRNALATSLGKEYNHVAIATQVTSRLCRVAAVSLLARYHSRREYNLNREERQKLIQTCVDLLHVGGPFSLRFSTQPPMVPPARM